MRFGKVTHVAPPNLTGSYNFEFLKTKMAILKTERSLMSLLK